MKYLLIYLLTLIIFVSCKPDQKKSIIEYISNLENINIQNRYQFYSIGLLRDDAYAIYYPDGTRLVFHKNDSVMTELIDTSNVSSDKIEDLNEKLKEMNLLNINFIEGDSCIMFIRIKDGCIDNSIKHREKTDLVIMYFYKDKFDSEKSQRFFKARNPVKIKNNWYIYYDVTYN